MVKETGNVVGPGPAVIFPQKRKSESLSEYEELHKDHKTTYLETLMHLFKGNVGTGCYAMADAIKHGGLLMGPILTIVIATISVVCQHMLLACSDYVKEKYNLERQPDYAETVEMCFASCKREKFQKMAPALRTICNVFICTTQLGFCSVYFVFVAKNLQNVLVYYGHMIEIHFLILIVLVPVMLTALIRQLKFIAIFSAIANFCMIVGIILTMGFITRRLPPISQRNLFPQSVDTLSIFFGIALFAFEGIALVLPLKSSMQVPANFSKTSGVLNVGMVFVTLIYAVIGSIGYWKYGEETEGSLTLNLPLQNTLAQVIILMIATGVMLGYAIQFFVAVQIMFAGLSWKFAETHPIISEIIFRSLLVLATFIVASVVPNLSLLLSLIGSVCCVVLAFVLPAIAELVVLHDKDEGISAYYWIKNGIILIIGLIAFLAGGFVSIRDIIVDFGSRINE